MRPSLFHLNADGSFSEMRPTAYDSEDVIQRLLARHPEVLAGDQFDQANPRWWALVARELSRIVT